MGECLLRVALLAEGVDRNAACSLAVFGAALVALLAEGVDRNGCCIVHHLLAARSPSSRRAWIEISAVVRMAHAAADALLAEGVDRNTAAVAGS